MSYFRQHDFFSDKMNFKLPKSWEIQLKEEIQKSYFQKLKIVINKESMLLNNVIHRAADIFRFPNVFI